LWLREERKEEASRWKRRCRQDFSTASLTSSDSDCAKLRSRLAPPRTPPVALVCPDGLRTRRASHQLFVFHHSVHSAFLPPNTLLSTTIKLSSTLLKAMASSLRLSNTLLRSSNVLTKNFVQKAAYTGTRCASTQVSEHRCPSQHHTTNYFYVDFERGLCSKGSW
jgi:hypothetical protein